jgi:hypothetical protein
MKRVMGLMLGVVFGAAIFVATFLEPRSAATTVSAAPSVVYVEKDKKKYHGQECRLLAHTRSADIISMSREDAEAAGLTPCRNPKCFPR